MAAKIQSGKNASIPYYSALWQPSYPDISVVRMQRLDSRSSLAYLITVASEANKIQLW